jgi:transcription antitermination factor NusG
VCHSRHWLKEPVGLGGLGERSRSKCVGTATVTHRAKLCPEFYAVENTEVMQIERPGNADAADPWWAIYTRHQHEKVVATTLSAKNFEVFFPFYESVRRWKDRKKVIWLPLFPCYVFVKGGVDRRLQVVTTPGVHMILHRGERVATIPEAEIEAIQRAVDGRYRIEPHPFLKCGERVRVIRGALEGVEGLLLRKKNWYRLVLSVDMLAQSIAVEVNSSDVEPVAAQLLPAARRAGAYPPVANAAAASI